MSATSKIDSSTLGWVKTEIDETLKQARLALESFAENTADETRLRFCITHLHQVVGTLEMVELDGVAFLAKETELLARDIIDDKVKPDIGNLETLTQAILTIPDYLSRLQFGQSSAPARFTPTINAMRQARGMETISEVALFEPDLSVRPVREKSKWPSIDEVEFRQLAKKLRHPFQLSLLKWLRNTRDKDSLNEIASILDQLGQQANVGVVEQLFWVADGYVEALLAGDLPPTNERKRLFSRLDQQIRKLVEGGGKSALRNTSESLIKSILYQIVHANSSGPKVSQLKQAFELDQFVGSAGEEEFSASSLPTPDALQSVSVALGKEVETAQDILSAFFDPDEEDVTSLQPLQEILHKMSSTLDMLNVPMLKSLIDELYNVTKGVIENRIASSEIASMAMARALLLFEHSAREIHKSAASWKRQFDEVMTGLQRLQTGKAEEAAAEGFGITETELSETEYNQLLGVVGDEIRINLNKIEEALETFAADTRRTECLDQVPVQLNQVQGALEILNQYRAAELGSVTLKCIEDIRSRAITADVDVLDGLAVAVGSIGAYVEGLQYNRPNLDDLIDRAVSDLTTSVSGKHRMDTDPMALIDEIRKQLNNWLQNTDDDSAIAVMSQHLDALSSLAQQQGQSKIERIGGEMNKLLQIIHDDPGQLSDDIVNTLKQSFDTLALLSKQYLMAGSTIATELVIEAAPPPMESIVDTSDAVAAVEITINDDVIDDEILEIFIEDACEVMKTVEAETTNWTADPHNKHSLLELRRGYHTLKGSGRMVGASTISELAWAIENMLNHVRDGKISHSPAMLDLLKEVQGILPGLIDKFERSETVTVDTESLKQRADEIAKLSNAHETATTAPAETVAFASVVAEPEQGDIPQLDDTLLQIFTSEASDHLQTIKTEIKNCMDNAAQCNVSPSLLRATHTLRGSARSLGLPQMAEVCGETEQLLQELQSIEAPLSEKHLQSLREMESCVSALVVVLNEGRHNTPDELSLRFVDLLQIVHAELLAVTGAATPSEVQPIPEIPAVPQATPMVPPFAETATVTPLVSPTVAATSTQDEGVDNELLEIFLEEAVDILNAIDSALSNWHANPEANYSEVHELKRGLHTLKGGARMAGLMTIGDLSHATESALGEIEGGSLQASSEVFELLHEVHDTLVTMIDQMVRKQPLTDTSDLHARVHALFSDEAPVSSNDVSTTYDTETATYVARSFDTTTVSTTPIPAIPAAGNSGSADIPLVAKRDFVQTGDSTAGDTGKAAEKKERGEVTRVRTGLLDSLVNFAGEVSISRSRMEQQIYGFRENLKELHDNVDRFRNQLRELEIQSESQILFRTSQEESEMGSGFDPLEFDRFSQMQHLSRGLNESLHDLSTIQIQLDNFVGEAETTLQQQARTNTELQEGLMRTRMVSFSTQSARLRHIVRQTARELGKRVELKLVGSEVEVDRNVLERMIGPFEHMIRNSIDHGMEDEYQRQQSGKNPVGTITIDTQQQGSEIIIRFSDDGQGLNVDKIRQKAIEKGLMSDTERVSEDGLVQYILVSGFSTAAEVTHFSGRGVGMDVVHNEVKQLGGSMAVDTERGQGTSFIISLPLTLSVTQALMIFAGEQLFAVPLSSVENIVEANKDELDKLMMGQKPMFNYNDQVYPYVNLAHRLGVEPHPRHERKVPVLLVKTGTRNYAMEVDALAGTREVVIKALGALLGPLAGFSGATVMGDGKVILILDIPGLMLSDEGMVVAHSVARKAATEKAPMRERPLVMIVDDSLTVRKVTSRHLERNGMDVLTAKDGLDAVEQLRETIPDIMLVDIEMPRMDGYELTSRVRAESELKHIPIIMITSRAGEKHRKRAFDLGVNDYMSKPYQEEQLFANINRLLAETAKV